MQPPPMRNVNVNFGMRWRPSPAIKASAVLHLGAAAVLGLGVDWPWAAGTLIANHALLTAAGLWPRSTLLGSNMRHLSPKACAAGQVAITIDDGPHPQVTPLVLDVLDAFNAKASFFCIGKSVEAYPQLARDIVMRGHSIENHSHQHPHHFSLMGIRTLTTEISRAQNAIFQATGYTPRYFRAPAGLRSPLLDPVLQNLNLELVSWTRRGFDTIEQDPAKVRKRLEHKLSAGDILLLHDGNCAMTPWGQPVILDVLPKLLNTLQNSSLHAVSLNYAT
jgi:peptidoglycan/xylan/chitin deacetylase (PgdA/CDA1 family)